MQESDCKLNMNINKTLANKVLETVDAGLTKGMGKPIPGQMCVEAAVCFAMGLPHSDNPTCVGKAVRAFKIHLNDASWSSNVARATGMRKLAVAQLGSDKIDQVEFAKLVSIGTVNRLIPELFQDIVKQYPEHKDRFNNVAKRCKEASSLDEAREAADAANAAAANAAANAADYASYAANAANYAANAAANAAADKYLAISAEIALEALIKLKSPGCEYLYLTNHSS